MVSTVPYRVSRKVYSSTLAVIKRAGKRLRIQLKLSLVRRVLQCNANELQEVARQIKLARNVRFFIAPASSQSYVSSLGEHYPNAKIRIIRDAKKICCHIFDLLGSGETFLGEKINWHLDWKSGFQWKSEFYLKLLPVSNAVDNTDGKIPWELSRFQHLPTLGKAYWFTGDEKYTREFTREINDWIDNNPPLFGINWTSPMEVAIRAVNWIWGYYFFRDSPELSDRFLLKFLKSLLVHGRHIRSNLERTWTGMNTNHYLSNLVGLVYLGIMFPEFKEAEQWRNFGVRELIKEMAKEVYADGVDYEGSISYHRLVSELFLSTTLLCLRNGITFPTGYMERLERMLDFIRHYVKPDGTAPQIGDNDDGRLHILSHYPGWDRLDHRYLLSAGAVLFNRPDFKQAAGEFHEEAFWLLGEEGLAKFNNLKGPPVAVSSQAFTKAGFYIMRAASRYMIIDSLTTDRKTPSGHTHNSRLSFELFAGDKSFIIDPGAYIYTADREMRNLFRSTRHHNTVVVDGREQNRFDEGTLFGMGHDAVTRVNTWQVADEYDFFDAEHNGYGRLKNPVVHQRQIYFSKADGYWIVRDVLSGRGEHQYDLYFHLAPLAVELDSDFPLVVKTRTEGMNIAIIPLETDGISLEVLDGWVSYQYGVKTKAPVVKYCRSGRAPTRFNTLIYPYQRDIDVAEVVAKVQKQQMTAEMW